MGRDRQGLPGGYVAQDGDPYKVAPGSSLHAVQQFDSPGDLGQPAQETLTLQDLEVVVHDGGGAHLAPRLDVADRWRKLVLVHEIRDEVQHALLPWREFPFHEGPLSGCGRVLARYKCQGLMF